MKISESVGFVSKLKTASESQVEELRSLIDVTEPYYALSDLHIDEEFITASIPLELTDHLEHNCMPIAEVGRHMAILGSVAMARANPRKEKHYYLATDAVVERIGKGNAVNGDFFGKVWVKEINKRNGIIQGELYTAMGELHCTVEVKYAIIHEVIFKRMFSDNVQPTSLRAKRINPYEKQARVYNKRLRVRNSMASLGVVQPENCVGHFDDLPALPIARLGASLISLAGDHYNFIRNTENSGYFIRKAEIHAKSFIFAGNKVDIFSQVIDSDIEDTVCIETYAHSGDCCRNAELKLWFE